MIHLVQGAERAGIHLRLTSGIRSKDQQERMYKAWVEGGRKGYPVAKPGTSGHNSGQSIDATTRALGDREKSTLNAVAGESGLPWAGAKDAVHFGAGFGSPISQSLIVENNTNPHPTATIVVGQPQSVSVSEAPAQVPYSPAPLRQTRIEALPECPGDGSGCKN